MLGCVIFNFEILSKKYNCMTAIYVKIRILLKLQTMTVILDAYIYLKL